ncbi:hypothetical protein [Leptolyngbya iicbica]|uniref:Uncharacterized protein n=2 Tax=Cyanophyceae TaxID=3028117 RepID=A0A4Q7E6C7_9CYAN|nr:hypothetical protein [Leptolyngbya sp. LK]RZM77753.1 hypothetical protein DYY88_14330 [Leptolyngbya sp. LK]
MTSSFSFAALDRFVASLEQSIQQAIAETMPDTTPTIRCRFQQGRLLVLSEDKVAAVTADDRDQRFTALAVALDQSLQATEVPDDILTDDGELSVRLYLRELGTASPYAARTWHWQQSLAIADLPDSEASEETEFKVEAPSPEVTSSSIVLVSPSHDDTADEAAASATPTSVWQAVKGWTEPGGWRQSWQAWSENWQELPWRSVLGLALAGVTVGAIAYGTTRPCTFGSCEERQTASDLSQETLDSLTGNPTPDEVQAARQDLQTAIRLVAAIPPWSSHYDAAQAELLRYRTQLSDLEWVIAAQKSATQASETSQEPPHPVPVWVEVHLLWQKAVNHLQRVPEESYLAGFANRKLREYEANYEAIGDRLVIEEAAEASLNEAIEAGDLAIAQTETATTLNDWRVAQREWNRAMQAISNIPQGTLAYEEARSLLSDYRRQSIQTRTRVTFEQSGERAYQDALAQAAQAQTAERNNQWTQAVSFWQEAYAQMRQVPKNTLRYADAQALLDSYQGSLKQAQTKLKQAVALQSIDEDLATLCPLADGICTYTYSPQQVTLMVREPYDSAIRQSISPPSTQGRLNRNDAIMAETHQLVQNIMQLGNQVQLPIVLYDDNRQLIARYKPEYGGFVKN